MSDPQELGLPRHKNFYENYIEEWVLFKSNNDWEAGKFVKIEEGYAVLNPHQGRELRNGRLVNCLIKKDAGMRIDQIVSYRVMSEETLLAHCEEGNRQNRKVQKT